MMSDTTPFHPQAARSERIEAAQETEFDAAIIGGGVNGACLYDQLCRTGYRVALFDGGDFACGTSQASAMMVWGGLLYLRGLDLGSVYRFSRARDRMIDEMSDLVSPLSFRYCAEPEARIGRYRVLSGLYLYWLIGRFNRRQPKSESLYPEAALLAKSAPSLTYEEAILNISDSRFVLQWITPHALPGNVALNYCPVEGGDYNAADKMWRLRVRDRFELPEFEIRSRFVINCAGAWTDRVNNSFSVGSPYKHVFSKGVYINFAGSAQHQTPLIFEMGEHNDVLTSVPWGPVAMWGPTETAIEDLDSGFVANADDIGFLLDHRNRCLRGESRKEDIVALRCGVRPLAVKSDFNGHVYPLGLSRKYRIFIDPDRPWVSTYGGKLTGCTELAASVACKLRPLLSPVAATPRTRPPYTTADIPQVSFPGLKEPVPDANWCRTHEFCCTLEDYLRRRTNISQWVPRNGLGWKNEHLPYLHTVCLALNGGDAEAAKTELARYSANVTEQFDRVLQSV